MIKMGVGSSSVFETRYDREMAAAQRQVVMRALRDADGNACRAAEYLGIHRNTLSRIVQQLGMNAAEVRRCIRAERGRVAA